jgi:excinuclease ABC subunit C
MATAVDNAANLLRLHTARRAGDLTTRSLALQEVQDALGLQEPPLRIECIDVSTLQGQDTVASLVVFEDGLPRKSDYRSYVIRTPGADDLASVAEVVQRRFARVGATEQAEQLDGDEQRSVTRFAYPPSLLVIDGGAPQVRAAQDALMAAGASDVAVIGLAKRLEEVWVPGESDPVILPRTSEALYLLQRIRDEAHRRAIGHHRQRRGRRSTASILDDVPGLGKARATALRRHFGSVRAMREASVAQIQQVPGIGPSLAASIHAALHPQETDGHEG